jgi:hypothetical protein
MRGPESLCGSLRNSLYPSIGKCSPVSGIHSTLILFIVLSCKLTVGGSGFEGKLPNANLTTSLAVPNPSEFSAI